jgi:hypothetical protein
MLKHRLQRIESLLDVLDQLTRRQRCLPARRLQTAQDVIDLLQEQVEAIRHEALADTLEKARAVGYLAGQARKAIETGTLAARLEALEQVVAQGDKDGR